METFKKKCVVTGGSGFVGKALCHELIRQDWQVVSVSRRDVPELRDAGVTVIQQDLTSGVGILEEHLQTAEVVFHTAAKVGMWGRLEDFLKVNVEATRTLLNAAKRAGVRCFIYTSSPSVVAGGEDLKGVDESQPYPKHFEAFYPQTKSMAEKIVLAAHNAETSQTDIPMRTAALRPHLIFGPGDTNLIPAILEKAESGALVQIGDGSNLTDITFIEDCVQAHIAAAESLLEKPDVGGRAYFISQGEPVNMWNWINDVLSLFDKQPVTRKVPVWLAKLLATVSEGWAQLRGGDKEPRLTRFLVSEMATSHYFDISAARNLLGYKPQYSVAAAMKKTRESFQTGADDPQHSEQKRSANAT